MRAGERRSRDANLGGPGSPHLWETPQAPRKQTPKPQRDSPSTSTRPAANERQDWSVQLPNQTKHQEGETVAREGRRIERTLVRLGGRIRR